MRIATRLRLDAELVRRQLAVDLEQARVLIQAHRVHVNGSFADTPRRLVNRGDSIELVRDAPAFVSRGGDKLAGALEAFEIDPGGKRCLDAGASTGGFTDCLVQRGAATVIAIDVGYGQLHESLVANPHVINYERTNVRHVVSEDVGGPVDLVVGDLSFISLRTVLGTLAALCVPGGATLVLLVKPQFEATRAEASRGNGVIRDPEVWARVLSETRRAANDAGLDVVNVIESPLRGGDGNVEFFVHLGRNTSGGPVDLDAIVAAVEI